ncbi:hypothetical protein MPSEU_000855800 [Mayamaea pseudoterrestris]|nr:hypothetical protein MPSEU_000855800 [Mayamaea pseudoterrestris]
MALTTTNGSPATTSSSKDSSAFDDQSEGSDDEWEYLVDRKGVTCDQDDDDDDEFTLLESLRAAWKQHVCAILVAILATIVYACYQQLNGPAAESDVLAPTAVLFDRMHTHLKSYQRTANITFCNTPADADGELLAKRESTLVSFEFTVPKSLLPAMILHYAADFMQDDDYSHVLLLDNQDLASEALEHSDERDSEIACLKQQVNDGVNLLKGHARYYQSPTLESMYLDHGATSTSLSFVNHKRQAKLQPAHLTFTGFAAKFFNISPQPLLLFWDGSVERKLVGEIAPFESLGTATTPGQSFSLTPVHDSSHALARWTLTADDCLVYYENPNESPEDWSETDLYLYQMQLLTKEFATSYLIHARRPWLAQFPRPYPQYFMWQASHFGQVQAIPDSDLTLKTESVEPRVFSIKNFLTSEECDELVKLALTHDMQASTVYSGSLVRHQRDLSTRSSTNTWLERATTDLTNRIYERAAKVLQIDQSLLQAPMDDDVHANHHSIAESLQVVRYKENEEYAPHHDFVYPSQKHRMQPTRFATLLLYLNDNFEGGETRFPRATNANFHDGITIEPKKGTAILFYNVLPDGNVDDLSQHSGQPVTKGEKFLANLWVWEPVIN